MALPSPLAFPLCLPHRPSQPRHVRLWVWSIEQPTRIAQRLCLFKLCSFHWLIDGTLHLLARWLYQAERARWTGTLPASYALAFLRTDEIRLVHPGMTFVGYFLARRALLIRLANAAAGFGTRRIAAICQNGRCAARRNDG